VSEPAARATGERFEVLVGAAVLANNLMRIAELLRNRKPARSTISTSRAAGRTARLNLISACEPNRRTWLPRSSVTSGQPSVVFCATRS